MAQLKWQLIFLAFVVHRLSSVEAAAGPMKRIINGFNATAKQFPYQAFLDTNIDLTWYPYCGGVIITNRWILTAAHCVDQRAKAFNVYLGAVDKSNPLEVGQQQLQIPIENVIVHPEWDRLQLLNDIALLRTQAIIHFSDYIQAAKLPDPKQLYANQYGVVSGWGTTDIKVGGSANILQYYDVGILSLDDCTTLIHGYAPAMFIPESYICLKPSGSTPCFGDSGGPLAKRNPDGSSTLLGLTSFRLDSTCQVNMPTIYTRVSSYLTWIQCQIDAYTDCC